MISPHLIHIRALEHYAQRYREAEQARAVKQAANKPAVPTSEPRLRLARPRRASAC